MEVLYIYEVCGPQNQDVNPEARIHFWGYEVNLFGLNGRHLCVWYLVLFNISGHKQDRHHKLCGNTDVLMFSM